MGIKVQGGGNITSLEAVNPDTIENNTNKPRDLIYGLVDFQIKVANPGNEAQVTIYLSSPAPDDYKWYKYGHKYNDQTGQYETNESWYDYSQYAQFNGDRDQVTLTLVDGGVGDDDRQANGMILDDSGLGTASGDGGSGDDGGGGSCFIGTAFGSGFESHGQMKGLPVVLLIGLVAGGCMTLRRPKTRKSG